jgi:hypothetical protein
MMFTEFRAVLKGTCHILLARLRLWFCIVVKEDAINTTITAKKVREIHGMDRTAPTFENASIHRVRRPCQSDQSAIILGITVGVN